MIDEDMGLYTQEDWDEYVRRSNTKLSTREFIKMYNNNCRDFRFYDLSEVKTRPLRDSLEAKKKKIRNDDVFYRMVRLTDKIPYPTNCDFSFAVLRDAFYLMDIYNSNLYSAILPINATEYKDIINRNGFIPNEVKLEKIGFLTTCIDETKPNRNIQPLINLKELSSIDVNSTPNYTGCNYTNDSDKNYITFQFRFGHRDAKPIKWHFINEERLNIYHNLLINELKKYDY